MTKENKKFLVFSVRNGKHRLLMEFQFFDTYALKIRKSEGKTVTTFLEVAHAESIVDKLLLSNFPEIEYEQSEDPKEKAALKKLRDGEKVII